MIKIISIYCYLTTLLVVTICLINGAHCGELKKGSSDNSPIIIGQPKELCECESESKFKNQVIHNYDIMLRKLAEIGCSCNERDLAEFKKLLKEMKNKILDIVDAYFKCGKKDPTEAILKAIECYDSTRARFRKYGRNAFNELSPKCNEVIQYVRKLPYISAEYTLMPLLTCAKLKTQKTQKKRASIPD